MLLSRFKWVNFLTFMHFYVGKLSHDASVELLPKEITETANPESHFSSLKKLANETLAGHTRCRNKM